MAFLYLAVYTILSAFSIEVFAGSDLPPVCMMEGGCTCEVTSKNVIVSLSCPFMGLRSLPNLKNDLFRHLTSIDFQGNKISVIKAADLDPIRSSIQSINLDNNEISVIEDQALRSMLNLTSLRLSNNSIDEFPSDVFQSRTSVDTLDLSFNNLSAIPRGITSVTNYKVLRFDGNPMNDLKTDAFSTDVMDNGRVVKAALRKIGELNLSNLGMTGFNAMNLGLSGLTSLKYLYLDQNNFVEVNDSSIKGLPTTLNTLSLRMCGIKTLGRGAFEDIPNLKNLYLDGNDLGILKGFPFRGLSLDILDLAYCNITDVKRTAFQKLNVSNLYLSHNKIEVIHRQEFMGINNVTYLDLRNSSIREIRGSPFSVHNHLRELVLLNNDLTDDSMVEGLLGMPNLTYLVLSGNRLTKFPSLNGSHYPYLRSIFITHNKISSLHRENLRSMTSLRLLLLKNNPLEFLEDDVFAECPSITDLDFDHTHLTQLPNMTYLPNLLNLHINHARLRNIPEDLCFSCFKLAILEANNNELTEVPSISCQKLVDLDVSHNQLTSLHPDLLKSMKHVRSLDLENNYISELDQNFFENSVDMEFLYLGQNRLTKLPSLERMSILLLVNVSYNRIRRIDRGTFANQVVMSKLYLNDNQINYIDPFAFAVHSNLRFLNLSRNHHLQEWILPSGGFKYLAILAMEDLYNLYQAPHRFEIPNVKELYFTYAYHCCIWNDFIERPNASDNSITSVSDDPDSTDEIVKPTGPLPTLPSTIVHCDFPQWAIDFYKEFFPNVTITLNKRECIIEASTIQNDFGVGVGAVEQAFFTRYSSRTGVKVFVVYKENVRCTPHQNPLTPCESLMDPWVLRVAIWAVWVLAILGNGMVLFIGIAGREKLETSEFLVCNLAFADFCMGVYLAFLAIVDVRTFGDKSFYQSALDWQLGPGCKSAGFIALFSSELSMYILVVLTLERVYTIASAFNQDEKKKKRIALFFCILGWMLAAGLAILPIFGINSYDKVAVCLPYLTEDWIDKFYIGVILTINFAGFLTIVLSYAYVFVSACRNTPSNYAGQRRKDIAIAASKITVLILTAFLCWAPIALIGYLAIFDIHIVSTAEAKFFIVFVYPLNACVNPFIYAIFTRRFRMKFAAIFQRSKDRITSFPPHHQMRLQRSPSAFTSDYQMSRICSPGSQKQEELMKLRQSRRSNSLVVQLVDTNLPRPSPTFNPPVGCNLGRRASLPPEFGSTLNSLNLTESSSDKAHFPHYALPFRLGSLYSSNNSSLPNLQEESDVDIEVENETVKPSPCEVEEEQKLSALTSSQESNLRRLSVVEEENEVEVLGNSVPDDPIPDDDVSTSSISSESEEEYSDATDSLPYITNDRGTDLDHMINSGIDHVIASDTTSEEDCTSIKDSGSDTNINIQTRRKRSLDSSIIQDLLEENVCSKALSCDDMQLALGKRMAILSTHHPSISNHSNLSTSAMGGRRRSLEQFASDHEPFALCFEDRLENGYPEMFNDSHHRVNCNVPSSSNMVNSKKSSSKEIPSSGHRNCTCDNSKVTRSPAVRLLNKVTSGRGTKKHIIEYQLGFSNPLTFRVKNNTSNMPSHSKLAKPNLAVETDL